MKIQITTQKPDEVQHFFSAPLSLSQKVRVKKSLILWRIFQSVKTLGRNPGKLTTRK